MATLISKDNEAFHISEAGVNLMTTVSNMIDTTPEKKIVIPFKIINSATLKYVVEYIDKYLENPFTVENTPLESVGEFVTPPKLRTFTQWEDEFFNIPWSMVNDIMKAANYLEFDILINSCAQFVASQIIKKTPEELAEYLST